MPTKKIESAKLLISCQQNKVHDPMDRTVLFTTGRHIRLFPNSLFRAIVTTVIALNLEFGNKLMCHPALTLKRRPACVSMASLTLIPSSTPLTPPPLKAAALLTLFLLELNSSIASSNWKNRANVASPPAVENSA